MQKSGAPLIGAFVGNKCDFRDGSLDSRAEVGVSEARAVAEAAGMKHFETSAVRYNIVLSLLNSSTTSLDDIAIGEQHRGREPVLLHSGGVL